MSKVYIGLRAPEGEAVVVVDEGSWKYPLKPRLDLVNHSPTGLEWGYWGSGPAQLAVAILADATGDDQYALEAGQAFKFAVVAKWDQHLNWFITHEAVMKWVAVDVRESGRR